MKSFIIFIYLLVAYLLDQYSRYCLLKIIILFVFFNFLIIGIVPTDLFASVAADCLSKNYEPLKQVHFDFYHILPF